MIESSGHNETTTISHLGSSNFSIRNSLINHSDSTSSINNSSCQHGCGHGVILPPWEPQDIDDKITIAYRAIVYVACLAYLLFGVSIITDRIVSAMEVIASQKRTVKVKLKSGATKVVKVPFWHPVVVALTVTAIGTSSPEIFLPLIEIFRTNFQGDELGPSLIVGSGAFHLFIITGVCLLSVQETLAKPIEDRYVFFTTTACAIFAYLWVYLLLGEISPGHVELWEGVATLAFFPAFVLAAWAVSRRFPHKVFCHFSPCLRIFHHRVMPGSRLSNRNDASPAPGRNGDFDDSPEDAARRKLTILLQQLKDSHPEMTQIELEEMAEIQLLEDTPKNAAFYRLQATTAIYGNGNVITKEKIKEKLEEQNRKAFVLTPVSGASDAQAVGFTSAQNTCNESCGSAVITVRRSGPSLNDTIVTVDYETRQGTAKPSANYVHTNGKLTFNPGQQVAEIPIGILDDGIYEESAKAFCVRLSKPELRHAGTSSNNHMPNSNDQRTSVSQSKATRVELTIAETTISILDDDHCGIFTFPTPELAIPDNIDIAKIKVVRGTGTKGKIAVPYRISAGTAKPNQDYVVASPKGILHFDDGQTEQFIEIKIIDKNRFGNVNTFYIELLQPKKECNDVKSTIGLPTIGANRLVQVGICEDEELKDALDRLLKMTNIAEYVSGITWLDQLQEAVTIFHETPKQNEEAEKTPMWRKLKIYSLHIISLPWRLLVAFLPPARLLHGWVAYLSLLALMAVISTLIGDCATFLGCTIGLKDTVTAVALISPGMALPDTFASRHAAIHEKTADAAIGQIAGANAVSVYLGIGIAWTVGAVHELSRGKMDGMDVKSKNLGFSVILYCSFATAGVLVLLLRRLPPCRGELGGPTWLKFLSATFFILLWLIFIGMTILQSYQIIPEFRT